MTTRSRRIGGIVLLVLAALLVPVAVIATWTARTVTDTDAFVSRVAPVASTPEVQVLIEQEMTEQITTAVIDDRAAPLVNGAIDSMAAPDLVKNLLHDLAAGVGSAVESRTASVVKNVVEAPEFASAFESATRTAHADLVATLEGENTGTVVTEGDTVSIRLATVGNAVRAELVSAGFSFVDRIPPLNASIPIATVEQLDTWQGYYQVAQGAGLARAAARDRVRRGRRLAGARPRPGRRSGSPAPDCSPSWVRRWACRAVLSGATDAPRRPGGRRRRAGRRLATFTGSLVRNVTVVGLVLAVLLAVSAWFFAFRRADGAGTPPPRPEPRRLRRGWPPRAARLTVSTAGSSCSRTTTSAYTYRVLSARIGTSRA